MPEITQPPEWGWWILAYFFVGGIAAGLFILGALLRLARPQMDQAITRPAFLTALPLTVLCAIFLIVDLGRPDRFLNMLFNFGQGELPLKVWSPMSVGAWFLFVFGACATIMFVNELVAMRQKAVAAKLPADERVSEKGWRRWLPLRGVLEKVVLLLGLLSGIAVAGYTGVLLTSTNQPVWSNTWLVGALFTASALSTSAATFWLLLWPLRKRAAGTMEWLSEIDSYFVSLEILVLLLMLFTLGNVSSKLLSGIYGWLLWIGVLVLGLILPLALHFGRRWQIPAIRLQAVMLAGILVLAGGFLLRYLVIFAPQV